MVSIKSVAGVTQSGTQSRPEMPAMVLQHLMTVERRIPRIAYALRLRWGQGDFEAYVDSLLIDDRGGRAGFPPDVAAALFSLSRLHAEQFPSQKRGDLWTHDPGNSRR